MKLYKNVDIKDLQAILREGIQPISVTGNNNWSDGKRASNSEDVVYLFETIKGESNTFPQYGMALLIDADGTVVDYQKINYKI